MEKIKFLIKINLLRKVRIDNFIDKKVDESLFFNYILKLNYTFYYSFIFLFELNLYERVSWIYDCFFFLKKKKMAMYLFTKTIIDPSSSYKRSYVKFK